MQDIKGVQPILQTQRIQTLDILRGFAIFGIFVVNIEIMNCVFVNQDAFAQIWTEPIHKVVVRIFQLFFYSKFFPIFSFLFGIGMALQMKRFEEKEVASGKANKRFLGVSTFFWRRMLGLFLFGACHVIFLWGGDVLHVYAVLGLFVSFFMKRNNALLIGMAVFLLVFPFYDQVTAYVLELLQWEPYKMISTYKSEEITSIISQGNYLEGMEFRLREYVTNTQMILPFLMPTALSMFLLGIVVVKKGWLFEIPKYLKQSRKAFLIVFILSNAYRLFFLFVSWDLPIWKIDHWRSFLIKVMQVAEVLMALCMIWFVAWLLQKTFWKRVLAPLAKVGKMALTNYILQSVLGVIIFTSLGLGKYETMSPTLTFGVACLSYIGLIILSALWLRYFRFGPLEWAWRCISYGKVLAIRKWD